MSWYQLEPKALLLNSFTQFSARSHRPFYSRWSKAGLSLIRT